MTGQRSFADATLLQKKVNPLDGRGIRQRVMLSLLRVRQFIKFQQHFGEAV
jgi:hypothetical protein